MKVARLTAHVFLSTLLILATIFPGPKAEDSQYTPGNPPPASFIDAGPTGGLSTPAGEEAFAFQFVAIIHSLEPKRIQVLNADTKQILVDDQEPRLQPTPYKHPSKPSVAIYQWQGRSSPEAITDTDPAWLHEADTTTMNFQILVTDTDGTSFSFTQPARFVLAAKKMLIEGAALNRKNFPKQE